MGTLLNNSVAVSQPMKNPGVPSSLNSPVRFSVLGNCILSVTVSPTFFSQCSAQSVPMDAAVDVAERGISVEVETFRDEPLVSAS